MNNLMIINGVKAIIDFDPDIEMFRGEFVGLNGGADFYAKDVDGLKREGEISLRVFLDMCEKDKVDPYKRYSGKLMFRVDPGVHEAAIVAAQASGMSLNQWAEKVLNEAAHAA